MRPEFQQIASKKTQYKLSTPTKNSDTDKAFIGADGRATTCPAVGSDSFEYRTGPVDQILNTLATLIEDPRFVTVF